jgi:hypothetical protein
VTTEKDIARLRGDPAAVELVARSAVLPVVLTFRDAAGMEAMVGDFGAAASRRRQR